MIALIRMRLTGFLRGGRAVAPLITVLAVLSVLHGGGKSSAASAYGYSAVCLFPILAWLTKLLLDTEPDAQRRLARLAVGPVREAAAGLLAATLAASVVCVLAMVTPWLFRAIEGPRPGSPEPSLTAGVLLGVLAHVLSMLAAVALGALAARAVTRAGGADRRHTGSAHRLDGAVVRGGPGRLRPRAPSAVLTSDAGCNGADLASTARPRTLTSRSSTHRPLVAAAAVSRRMPRPKVPLKAGDPCRGERFVI
jgi:hypothetical protein